jgi:hypothetical protein
MTTPEPPRRIPWGRALAALVVGLAIGIFLHYLAYRYSLPSKPFIYVSF